MNVSELIEKLKTMPQDSIVIMQRDAEGNSYSPLRYVDEKAVYRRESDYSGDVYSTNWSAHEAGMTAAEWKEFKCNTPPCVVLAPTN